MKKKILIPALLAALGLLSGNAAPGKGMALPQGPGDITARLRAHIESICAIGPRPAGSPNEGRAAAYVADRFLALGIIPRIEPVRFESFEPDGIELRIGGQTFAPAGLGLDPYREENGVPYEGEFLRLDGDPAGWPPPAAVAGKAVVAPAGAMTALHFRLAAMSPARIVYVSDRDLARIGELGARSLSLAGRGRLVEGTSRNVVAHLGSNPPAPQIVIGAHLDAYRDAPGANDNATGVAALLETAGRLKSFGIPPGFGLTFVAFGAEEAGLLGSRDFVERHAEELRSCRLALILDNLGGEGPVSIERDGGRRDSPGAEAGVPIPVAYRGRSWEGLRYPWKLVPAPALYQAIGSPYHPAWLSEAITTAVQGLGFDVRFTEMQGSDQMSFAAAGIATSGISAPNDRQHTSLDGPETVILETVRQGTEAACRLVRTVWSPARRQAPPREPSPGPDDPMAHVRFLASDELGGRRAGSWEGEIAADYVRACLRASGVAAFPAYPDFFQDVALPGPSPAAGRASNVVGFIRGSDPKRAASYVVLTAHYDHLGRKLENGAEAVCNGARDNALGVAALLGAARALALDPPARSVLILATTAEEEGLLGSRFFIEHSPIPLARLAFVLNNDGAGVTRPGLWRIGGLEACAVRPWVEAAGREHGLQTEPYPEAFRSLFARGDAFPFVEKGIPSLTVSPGFDAEDAARIEAYIHSPADRADGDFDEEYLSRYCRAFAGLARRIADAGPGDHPEGLRAGKIFP